MFLSLAIDDPRQGGGGRERQGQRRMLVGGSSGRLFVIDPSTRTLEYVHALHEGAINAVHLSAGFAVTGGADRKLRVWPLDFSAHFLEAEHEGGVTAITVAMNVSNVLVTCLAAWLIDRVGRRPLLLGSTCGMILTIFLLTIGLALPPSGGTSALVGLAVIAYVGSFGCGQVP